MTTVTGIRYHQPSDLVALSCDDSSIRIVDIETKKLVRELFGCKGTITDFVSESSSSIRWKLTNVTDLL